MEKKCTKVFILTLTPLINAIMWYLVVTLNQTRQLSNLVIVNVALSQLFTAFSLMESLYQLYHCGLSVEEWDEMIKYRIREEIWYGLLWTSIGNFVFGLVSMFVVYDQSKGITYDIWIIQYNIYISIVSIFLAAGYIKNVNKGDLKIKYSMFFILLMVSIGFFAHFNNFIEHPEQISQIYCEVVLLLFHLQRWWLTKNPLLMYLLLVVFESITFAQTLILKRYVGVCRLISIYQITKLSLLGVHMVVILVLIIRRIESCINTYFYTEKSSMPLNRTLIALLGKVQLSYNIEDSMEELRDMQIKSEIKKEIIECSICTQVIQNNSIVFDLKCKHYFHSLCLQNWLLLRNSCPTCREPVI